MPSKRAAAKSPGSLALKSARIWVRSDGCIRLSLNGKIRSAIPAKASANRQAHLYKALRELLKAEGLWIEGLPEFAGDK